MLLAITALLSSQAPSGISLTEGLAHSVRGGSRSAIRVDPIDLQIALGTFRTPTEAGNGWERVTAGKDGTFSGPAARSGYIAFKVESEKSIVMMLSSQGNSIAYVNGAPRGGDIYMTGYVSLPVLLRKGTNSLIFACGRGSFKASLAPPSSAVMLDTRDLTAPDLLPSDRGPAQVGVVVQNATENDLKDVWLNGRHIPLLPALSSVKLPCTISTNRDGKAEIRLVSASRELLATTTINLRKRELNQPYKRTFVSGVDGSVQYYGVNPSTSPGAGQALFLSLHGAGVEGIGQAEAYSPKSWGFIAAATNRRPFGFDWEDIGRRDAIEVLEDARSRFKTDASKTYLTGHSMGGHGTWQVGAHFPDRFAAIMPSAGWVSFASYGGGARYPNPTPIEKMLLRASASSDTLALKHNYAQEGVYVLHGDADDNVPVTEARTMRRELADFHEDLHWFEQKGAGHWWDASPEPGSDCVDWAAGFDLFSRRRIPNLDEIRSVDFTTECPGVSARDHWLTVSQQDKAFEPSRVQAKYDPLSSRYTVATSNVHAFSVQLPKSTQAKISFEIDGDKFDAPAPRETIPVSMHLVRVSGKWASTTSAPPSEKNPTRSGGFKSVFDHRVIAVFGTTGSREENEWARDKARFDVETFWIRGNGTLLIVADRDFDPRQFLDQNVILYGNQTSNSAYSKLIDAGDFSVQSGSIKLGMREIREDAGICAVRPRRDSNVASVAIVGGNSIIGMRVTTRASYFQSGAGFPDCLVLSPNTLATGTKGTLVAGFFGNDWTVANGDFVWQP